jgi:hypothetical protein
MIDWRTFRRSLIVGILLAPLAAAATEADVLPISIMEDGSLSVSGSAEIPPYAEGGRWTETRGRSSARYVTRHFMFMPPSGPPAMELYVARDLTGEPPDGAFEIGLVSGFVRGFASGAGFRYEEPAFEDVLVGGARLKRCHAELAKGDRRVWLYAYVLLRRPSLTFLTLRPRSDAGAAIEDYLKSVRLK